MPAARALVLSDDVLLGLRRGLPLACRLWANVRAGRRSPAKGAGVCWLWSGPVDTHGRPRIVVAQGVWRQTRRVAWTLLVGPLPDGARVHLKHWRCSPLCVRHLALTAPKPPGPPAGRKLTIDDVLRLKEALALNGVPRPAIARRFGISVRHLQSIVAGTRWGGVALRARDSAGTSCLSSPMSSVPAEKGRARHGAAPRSEVRA